MPSPSIAGCNITVYVVRLSTITGKGQVTVKGLTQNQIKKFVT